MAFYWLVADIHSFIPDISIAPLKVRYYSEFHAEAPQVTASEGLAQGPYMAARAGLKPAILRTKGVESTNEPPHPTNLSKLCSAPYRNYFQILIKILNPETM